MASDQVLVTLRLASAPVVAKMPKEFEIDDGQRQASRMNTSISISLMSFRRAPSLSPLRRTFRFTSMPNMKRANCRGSLLWKSCIYPTGQSATDNTATKSLQVGCKVSRQLVRQYRSFLHLLDPCWTPTSSSILAKTRWRVSFQFPEYTSHHGHKAFANSVEEYRVLG